MSAAGVSRGGGTEAAPCTCVGSRRCSTAACAGYLVGAPAACLHCSAVSFRHGRQLAGWGERAVATGLGIEEYHETTRDTHDFGRRVGQLPEQREKDGDVDYRSLLHRDGSVLSAITLEVQTADPQTSQHQSAHMLFRAAHL
jgi:hypothetical protein